MLRALAILLVVASCGDDTTPIAKGGKCVASSECAAGLLCDSATHTCLGMGTVDAAIIVDAPKADEHPPIDAM